jgi:1-pyrroline-5-carboxylate dehydrogenase
VVREVADELTAKIVARARALVVADPLQVEADLGPVIDEGIAQRLEEALRLAGKEGQVLTGARLAREGNWFSPIVVSGLPAAHPLTRHGLFGPFLTITEVDTFQDALDEANDVPYGLSAGVFSGDQAEVDQFVEQIEAGVIYINRAAGATTGAWPGVQSFCGWKRSGSVGKGGLGLWYVQGFMREQSRTFAKTTA